ncbi:uncharacterized protein DUF4349 [Nonlabens dokdonensis]|jgi:hypothetical protein|uniref:Uncharacterized protein DUF4349 n=2 Tax=Nonlabens dokdonensis TaxID=328515 RepID=A0ABX5PTN7_9FLAO|nr:DUF4349 domain-containing protein [Nonlabens dokdonensis]AGC77936.1 putative lipoprotein [Nonlabens dokdonensis DSW-6]PZX36632.1 uncharacterized protein DUF4349 [Nonlabens dokdonensis]
MKNTISIIATIALLLLSSCHQEGAYQESLEMQNESTPTTVEVRSTNDQSKTSAQKPSYNHLKIIKTADAKFKVKNLDSCTSKAQELIHKWNGYVADMRYTQNDYQLENRMVFKVPAANFDQLLNDFTQLADFVDYKNITSQDITANYVDLTTRLETKKEVKEKYDKILRSKAKTVEEVLKTEEKLRVLQEEIEAAEGRLKMMQNQVSLSTIEIEFYETVAYKKEPESYVITFKDQAINSVGYGWGFIKGAALLLLTLWPLFFIIPSVYFGIKWLRRK